MKIALISTRYPDSSNPGCYVFVHERVRSYQREGHDVVVFSRGTASCGDDYTYEGVGVRRGGVRETAALIRMYEPDVVVDHAPNPKFSSWLHPLLHRQFPVISWFHGFEVMRSPFYPEALWQTWLKLLVNRICLRRDAGWVGVSQWMVDEAARNTGFSSRRFNVIPNGIDTDLFPYEPRTFDECRLVSLRNFVRKYGLQLSIPVLNELKYDYDIYGQGTDAQLSELSRMNSSPNTAIHRVRLSHGEIPNLYRRFNVFLAPSLEEAQGIAMMEAMATGMPVIATRVGGIPEFVRDEIDGFLCSPSIDGLTDALQRFLALDSAAKMAMGRAAHEQSGRYSMEAMKRRELDYLAGQVAA